MFLVRRLRVRCWYSDTSDVDIDVSEIKFVQQGGGVKCESKACRLWKSGAVKNIVPPSVRATSMWNGPAYIRTYCTSKQRNLIRANTLTLDSSHSKSCRVFASCPTQREEVKEFVVQLLHIRTCSVKPSTYPCTKSFQVKYGLDFSHWTSSKKAEPVFATQL